MELLTLNEYVYCEKKKIAIYGFNYFTKVSLLFLAFHNIYVSVLISENDEILCKEYLGKKVLSIGELNDEYSVYDLFGDNRCLLKEKGIYARQLLVCNVRNAVIYGAGMYGKLCYKILKKFGCEVRVFCDQDKNKTGKSIYDCKIVSKEELKDYKLCDIVIGLDTYQAKSLENEFETHGGQIFYNNWSHYYRCGGNGVDSFKLNYARQRSDRMTLIGYKNDILALTGMMRCFDISINRAVDYDGYIGEESSIKFVDKYELVYEEEPAALYCVMENGKSLAGRFIDELGFKRSRFIFNFNTTIGNFEAFLDANMGYNAAESIHVLKTGNGKELKIGILGGSTSDIDLYGEKSWVEYLCDALGKDKINATFYVGAEKGYCSSQELIKLCRDMILYKPDIIISYSGVNDNPLMCNRRNTFITNYQEELFETIIRSAVNVNDSIYVEGTRKALCMELKIATMLKVGSETNE